MLDDEPPANEEGAHAQTDNDLVAIDVAIFENFLDVGGFAVDLDFAVTVHRKAVFDFRECLVREGVFRAQAQTQAIEGSVLAHQEALGIDSAAERQLGAGIGVTGFDIDERPFAELTAKTNPGIQIAPGIEAGRNIHVATVHSADKALAFSSRGIGIFDFDTQQRASEREIVTGRDAVREAAQIVAEFFAVDLFIAQ